MVAWSELFMNFCGVVWKTWQTVCKDIHFLWAVFGPSVRLFTKVDVKPYIIYASVIMKVLDNSIVKTIGDVGGIFQFSLAYIFVFGCPYDTGWQDLKLKGIG